MANLKLSFRPTLKVYRDDVGGLEVIGLVKPDDLLHVVGSPALAEAQIGVEGQFVRVRVTKGRRKLEGWIEGRQVERASARRARVLKVRAKSIAPLLAGDLPKLPVVAEVPAGGRVDVLEDPDLAIEKAQAGAGHWLRARTREGIVGWVDAAAVTRDAAGPAATRLPPRSAAKLLPNPDDPRWVERIVTSPGPTNYRTAPSAQSNETIIGQVRANDLIAIIEDDSLYQGAWIPIRVKGTVGWVSLQAITFATPLKPGVQLKIAHYSQTGPGAAIANDCGPAALAAVLRAYGQNIVSDSLYDFLPAEKRGNFTNFSDLIAIARASNLELTYYGDLAANAALDNLFRQLTAGYPCICLVNYSVLNPSHSFDGGHFVVAVGYGRETILLHDPLRDSGPTPVPTPLFLMAWGAFERGDNPRYAHLVARRPVPFAVLSLPQAQPTLPGPSGGEAKSGGKADMPSDRVAYIERARGIAFEITSAFEGSGRYDAFQTYDAGIISYGRFQFTLASGSLVTVVERFLAAVPDDPLREYLPRLQARDQTLRADMRLRMLLVAAAMHPAMQNAQDSVITERYWSEMLKVSAEPRGIKTALGLAFLFDMAVQRGIRHRVIVTAEGELGVPERSATQDEPRLLRTAARIHRDWLYAQAGRDNLPGLRPRGDFWFGLCERGDWDLQGDENGLLELRGRFAIRVRRP